ncbi:MAG: MerR family transcriptional regulator [Polyangiaceae bacterium]|nr:MerR family transcriptional regulator [Polyangiaceae bacterium]
MSQNRPLPDKLFFKIGEVAELVGVKPHVLRYWETEFSALRPKKTRGAHRHYSRRDVELAMLLRRLLHDEGFTVPGAKKKLRELGHHRRDSPPEPNAAREVALRAELVSVRALLSNLLDSLDHEPERTTEAEPAQVTVHQVVQSRPPRYER